ncbi:TonB-dependent receptor plug domain-containing protein [Duganella sp. S19_KUP01_CR8]|uniref:TonB-dependent receptor plug domain-containing protein n=1 Tax=Duganella sp. S19_KUP01_CR8 TaxID=3025502 RepID=UPI002FCD72D8
MIKETTLSRSVRMICVGGLALGLQAAHAQDASTEPVQKVQITGSRISAPGAESPSPLQILTSADIAASGAVNLQELLQKNPTLGTPTLSRTNSNFLTSGAGVSTVNLRNLGDSRTLVLVNGRRFVSGVPGSTSVDLNTIPTDFIERVEMLTGGASATYGSDAVAGVVNIILKKNFDGVLIDGQSGRSSKGDDLKKKLALTFGTTSADGASNIMGHFGYSKQGAVFSKDRERSSQDQTSAITKGHPELAFIPKSPNFSGYAPQGHFYGDSEDFTYDKNGNVIPWSTNGVNGVGATGYNRSALRTIAVPTERYLFALNGTHAFNDNHSAFFEGTYASTKASSNIEAFPLGSDSVFKGSGGQVPAGAMVKGQLVKNPLVPQYLYDRISDTDGDGIPDYFFTRRLSEFGARHSDVDRDTFRISTGLKGTVKDWNYETYVTYGKTKEAQSSTGQVNIPNLRNALSAIPGVAGGAPVCSDANAVAEGCVPINIFGFNTVTPEALKYVTAPGSLLTAVTQKLAGASVSGDLFELPAGKVGLAAGFEWRSEESSSVPDPLTQAGLNAGNATPPTYGKFQVREAFVETRIPLLKDKPFAKDVSFLGTFRHGDYSTVGSTNSWNAGGEWAVTSDFKIRATRAQSTRAPNINELYQAPSQDFPNGLVDPCEGVSSSAGTALATNCKNAPGVAANMAAHGGIFTLGQPDQQGISGYNTGNPDLKAEKGRSTTIGIVVTPRSIPLLNKVTFTADYFKINIADAIVGTDRQYALDQCYNQNNQVFCKFITRRPVQTGNLSAGSIKYSDTAVTNSGGMGTEGIDMTVSWADKVGPGRLSAQLAYTYLRQFWRRDIPEDKANPSLTPRNDDVGEITANNINAPRNKAVLNTAYKWGSFGATWTATYTGPVALDDQFLKSLSIAPGTVGVGSKTYNDFQFTYDIKKEAKKSMQVYFGINNAFDAKPAPIISGLPGSSTGTETDASTYDAIGRRYYLGLRVSL